MSTAPTRLRLSRAKGARLPAGAINVARPTKYGNPHRIGLCPICAVTHTAAEAVAEFRAMIETDWTNEIRERIIADLRGHDLACWCKPGTPCHADVLLEIANADVLNSQ